jgi:hypothetical protein
MRRLHTLSGIAMVALALASCTAIPEPAPQPAPPVAVPTAAPAPQPTPQVSEDWRDWPLTPGTWAYRQDARGSIALYGRAGADAELTLRCDRGRARLYLSRRGDGPATVRVRTSTTLRQLALAPTGGTPAYAAVELPPNDAIIDAIGFSRGRFVVEGGGLPTLVAPAWPEVLRIAEDCRG